MSTFSLSPYELMMLLHYSCSPAQFRSTATKDLEESSQLKLLTAELIAVNAKEERIDITDKGRAWLERALATPLPVQKWVWE